MDYNTDEYRMVSGQAIVQEPIYKQVADLTNPRHVHLVGLVPNEADYVIFCDLDDAKSDGYGGATLEFKVVNPQRDDLNQIKTIKIRGPWHSNSDSLFKYTGYDCRDKTYTQVIVARDRESGKRWSTILKDLVYFESDEKLGNFNRYKEIAQKYVDLLGIPLVCYKKSRGGSSCGFYYPTGWTREMERLFFQFKDLIERG